MTVSSSGRRGNYMAVRWVAVGVLGLIVLGGVGEARDLGGKRPLNMRDLIDSGNAYRRAYDARANAVIRGAKAIYQDVAFAGNHGRRTANAFIRSVASGKGDPAVRNADGSYNWREDTIQNPNGPGIMRIPRRIALGSAAQAALDAISARTAARRARVGVP